MSLRNFSVPSLTAAGVIILPPFATFPLPCVSLSHALEAHTTNRVRGECHGGIVPTRRRKGTARDRDLASYLTFPTRIDANMTVIRVSRTERLKIRDSTALGFLGDRLIA